MGGGTYGNFGKTFGSFKRSISKNVKHLYGRPGQIKKSGYKKTYIGPNGRAIKEVHYTDHGNPKWHHNPHEHIIRWENENPIFEKGVNLNEHF